MAGDTTPTEASAAAAVDPVTERAAARLRAALPDAVEAVSLEGLHPSIQVKAEHLPDAARLLRDDPDLAFGCCHGVTAVDWPKEKQLEVVYHLVSYARPTPREYAARRPSAGEKNDPWLALKVRVPRDDPRVPTVADVWIGADWHERETFDLLGVVFTGREELRRILLPEDWPGHPLRKDWSFPVSYHGVPIIPPEAQ